MQQKLNKGREMHRSQQGKKSELAARVDRLDEEIKRMKHQLEKSKMELQVKHWL